MHKIFALLFHPIGIGLILIITPILFSWSTLFLDVVFNRSKIDKLFNSLDLNNLQVIEEEFKEHKAQKEKLDSSSVVNLNVQVKYKGAKAILKCFKIN